MARVMMSMNALALVLLAVALLAVSLSPTVVAQQGAEEAAGADTNAASSESESTLRFAVMTDTSVFASSIVAEVETSCTITDSYEAAEDPEQRCHAEALQMCVELGDECGGYVIEPAAAMLDSDVEDGKVLFEQNVTGIKVKILMEDASQNMENLLTVPGATLYEKRQLVSNSELLVELYEEQRLADAVEEALATSTEIQEMEDELERRVEMANGKDMAMTVAAIKYNDITDRQLAVMAAELKEAVITDVFEKALITRNAKSARPNIPIPDIPYPTFPVPQLEISVPIVTCTPGSFTGSDAILGKVAYPSFTPYIPPVFTPKRCTLAQFTPTLCRCTAPIFVPKTCSGGLYIPGRKGRIIPPIITPARFTPPSCDVEYVEVHPGGFTHSP